MAMETTPTAPLLSSAKTAVADRPPIAHRRVAQPDPRSQQSDHGPGDRRPADHHHELVQEHAVRRRRAGILAPAPGAVQPDDRLREHHQAQRQRRTTALRDPEFCAVAGHHFVELAEVRDRLFLGLPAVQPVGFESLGGVLETVPRLGHQVRATSTGSAQGLAQRGQIGLDGRVGGSCDGHGYQYAVGSAELRRGLH